MATLEAQARQAISRLPELKAKARRYLGGPDLADARNLPRRPGCATIAVDLSRLHEDRPLL